MADKHIGRSSTPYSCVNCKLNPLEWLKSQTLTTLNTGEDIKQQGHSFTERMRNSLATLEDSLAVSYCWILRVLCIFWTSLLSNYVFCRYFLPVCGLSITLLTVFFHRARVFNFKKPNLLWFFFKSTILMLYQKWHCQTGHLDLLLCFFMEIFYQFIR